MNIFVIGKNIDSVQNGELNWFWYFFEGFEGCDPKKECDAKMVNKEQINGLATFVSNAGVHSNVRV